MSDNRENTENNGANSPSSDRQNQHTNDPGAFSQRGAHVNRSNEDTGGLKNDREVEKKDPEAKKGDADQDGTRNKTTVVRQNSGPGSGNLTEENQSRRTDKFGPERNSNTIGI